MRLPRLEAEVAHKLQTLGQSGQYETKFFQSFISFLHSSIDDTLIPSPLIPILDRTDGPRSLHQASVRGREEKDEEEDEVKDEAETAFIRSLPSVLSLSLMLDQLAS